MQGRPGGLAQIYDFRGRQLGHIHATLRVRLDQQKIYVMFRAQRLELIVDMVPRAPVEVIRKVYGRHKQDSHARLSISRTSSSWQSSVFLL